MSDAGAARVFFSYARRDGEAAARLFEALDASGLTVYRDSEEILPAEDWRGRLAGLIARADGFVFVMSPNSLRSDVCAWEVEQAAKGNKRIVPVAIAEVESERVPPELARLNYVFATPAHDFDAAIRSIHDACTTDIDWVRTHTTLGERAEYWERAGRPRRGRILRGDELAEAEAWLAAQPDTAPAPTSLQRAWIAAGRRAATQRQRSWVAGASTVAVVAIALGLVAELQRRIAAEQRDRAERILDRGSQTANDLVFDLAQRFRDRQGVPQDLVRDMLERSRALVDQLASAGEARPDLLRSRAAALTEMSITLRRQGDLDSALDAARAANVEFEALVAARPEVAQWRSDHAAGLDRLGDILLALDRRDEAAERFARSLAIQRALVADAPDVASHRLNLAVALEKGGTLALEAGEIDAALASLAAALREREVHDPVGRGTAVVLERIGDAELAREALDAAEQAYTRSLAITVALAAADPSDTRLARDLSVIHQKLGELQLARDDAVRALESFRTDVAIARRLYESDPARAEWAADLVVSEDRLGGVHWRTGAIDEAVAAFERAHGLARELASAETGRLPQREAASRAAQKLSLARFAAGDTAGALAVAERSAADLVAWGDLEASRAAALNNVAWYALFAAQPARALAASTEAARLAPDDSGYALNLAHALLLGGDVAAARARYLDPAQRAAEPRWSQLVADDFAALRDHDFEHPLMAEVLAGLADEGGGGLATVETSMEKEKR